MLKKTFLIKHFFIILIVSFLLILPIGCNRQETAEMQPSTPAASEPALEETPEPEPDPTCDALFYGDSITAGNNFDEFFPDLKIVDFGIRGATIEDLTARVSEVDAHHPDKIFVMAGGNNLYAGNIDECVELYRNLLDTLCEACPYAEIYVESMLPLEKSIAAKYECPNRVIQRFNERIADMAEEYGMPYLDIYPAYLLNGGLNDAFSDDGVHLKKDAFGPWADILRPYLEP